MSKSILVAAIVLFASTCQATPIQWSTASGGNGHWYEVVSMPEDVTTNEIDLAISAMGEPYAVIGGNGIGWWEAGVIANSRGGFLASIQSQGENDFIFSLINNPLYWDGGSGPWFGGLQEPTSVDYVEPDGGWEWSNSSVHPSVPYDSIFLEPMSYSNWYGLEPNNSGGYENVTHFCTEGISLEPSPYWNDRASNIPCNSFIIEYEVIPEPATLLLFGFGAMVLRKRK